MVVKVCVCVLDLTKIFAKVIKQAVRYMEVSPPTRKTDRLARRVLRREPGNVRFGSEAVIRRLSSQCPLCAKSGRSVPISWRLFLKGLSALAGQQGPGKARRK